MEKSEEKKTMQNFERTCKQNNLRLTPQRMMLYRELFASKDHPSADTLFKKAKKIFPNISFDTVNRTLLTFTRIGIVNVVEGHGDPRRFDPNIISHHHFHCVKCNDISDFYNQIYDNIKIPEDIQKSCVVLNKKVILEGICYECKN